MERSEQINEIAGALAKAQAKMSGAKKDNKNEHFKSKYADLESAWDACREALTANGLAVVQSPEAYDDGSIAVVTMLCHSSGQWMQGELSCKPIKFDAQGVGSVVTYLRRYALMAMVGIAPSDDDGEAAMGRPGPGAAAQGRPVTVQRGKPPQQAKPVNDNPTPPQPANEDADWPIWIEGFKNEFADQPHYGAARELWTAHSGVLEGLRDQQPALYQELLGWAKEQGEKLPKVGG